MRKNNKHLKVKLHLIKYGQITSMEAITNYSATRLSAIVFNLKKEGMDIETHYVTKKDRFNDMVRFANYKLITNKNK